MFEIAVGAAIMLFGGLIAYLVYLMNGMDRRKH
jgi:hypothetical protein